MKFRLKVLRCLSLLAVSLVLFSGSTLNAQAPVPQAVKVYWQSSRTLLLPGVTSVVVLDESICRAQVSPDQIELIGLTRGETLAFIWAQDRRITLRIKVEARPVDPTPPGLSKNALDSLGSGYLGSSMQTSIDARGRPDFYFLHHFEWQQQSDGARLSIHGQAQDSTLLGAPLFNANTASVQYSTSRMALSLIDFPLEVNGGMEAKVSANSAYNVYMLRGAQATLHRGANQLDFFAGATIPFYFLSLEGTRDIAGFNFSRKQSAKLYLYSTSGWVNSPLQDAQLHLRRVSSFFQTAGFAYRPNSQWAFQGTGGTSTEGSLAQGTVSYTNDKLTAFATGTKSSSAFPLNQLQLFFAGGSSLTAGASLRVNGKLTGSLYFQHSSTTPSPFFPVSGASDYLNPGLSYQFNPNESFNFNYSYTHSDSGVTLLGRTHGQRYDASWNSRFGERISNTAQFTLGALSDPLRLDAQGQFIARDVLSLPVRSGFLTFGFEHTRNNPSLARNLKDQIGLLPPALQQLFLLDPVEFTQSSQVPPELLALLDNLHPTDTEFTVSGQLKFGDRLILSPTAGYLRNTQGLGQNSSTNLFGYSLTYQAAPSLQVVSSLSNAFLFDSRTGGFRRTTVFTVGFNKRLQGTPRWLLPFRMQRLTIRGRVFRDLNVNGAYNVGEPGLAGVRVDLNTGESVRTNAEGLYEFSGLKPDAYEVSVPLAQFPDAVRATAPTNVRVEPDGDKITEVNFGIVNFARVMGNVFNDYLMNGIKQPDAGGLRGIRLELVSSAARREVLSDGTGDYELNEVAPGDYNLFVDRTTLPPNFMASGDAIHLHVAPTSTIIQDVPLQALRSIAGHVYFKLVGGSILKTSAHGKSAAGPVGPRPGPTPDDSNGNPILQPLPGVQIQIGDARTTTDSQGSFILRNLPAGELTLSIIPVAPLPPGLAAPQGKVRMPRDPIQVENATIVISNPELLRYLIPSPSGSSLGK
ncbi:MAG TPA: SdrD B-like domain-containing protein [Terriglobia bacterium]|nr:SdrD B-like domain-containing protein [Terriglobia bacterium]